MVTSTEFVKKLLHSGTLLERGRDYELSPDFVTRYNAGLSAGRKKREAVIVTLSEMDTTLTDEDLSEACIFIESFLEGNDGYSSDQL